MFCRIKARELHVFVVLCSVLCLISFFPGCTKSRDEITTGPEDELPTVKKPLLEYHPVEYLTTEPRSASILTREKHGNAWKRSDCIPCHRSTSKDTPDVCTDCHGKNGVNNQSDTCSSCHKVQSQYGEPASGNHQAHVTRGPRDINCIECHPGGPDGSTAHANGRVDVILGGDGKYTPVTQDKGIMGSCSNVACHKDVRDWGGSCSSCHYDPPDTGYHKEHLAQKDLSCQSCHSGNQHDSDKESGSIELGGIEYDLITGNCASECHKQDKWSCTDCHGYPPETGSHPAHEDSCNECHHGHKHSYNSAIASRDFSLVQIDFAAGGDFDLQSWTCSNTSCHPGSIVWDFSHAGSDFPLTGQHRTLDCARCHINGQYVIDTQCISCHQDDDTHQGQFGTSCESCHTTNGWRPSTFTHTFPLEGAHRKYGCNDCHPNSGNWKEFTCLGSCHPKSKMDDKHKEEAGYSYNSSSCLACHPQGKSDDD